MKYLDLEINFLKVEQITKGSYFWNILVKFGSILWDNISWRLGNRKQIHFWDDG